MFMILGLVILVIGFYLIRNKKTTNQPQETSSIRAGYTAFRQEVAPVAKSFEQGFEKAKDSFIESQQQKEVNRILSNPELLERLAQEARSQEL